MVGMTKRPDESFSEFFSRQGRARAAAELGAGGGGGGGGGSTVGEGLFVRHTTVQPVISNVADLDRLRESHSGMVWALSSGTGAPMAGANSPVNFDDF